MRKCCFFAKPLLLACFMLIAIFCFGQFTEKWVNRQNGDANSPDMALAADHKGNVYVQEGAQELEPFR